jgi:putative FmdB family regulatory protein
MPTYDYQCLECRHRFEESQKITADPLTICPQCHKEALRRGPGGGSGLLFKGSGFYINDYGKGSSQESPQECSKESPKEPSGGSCGSGCGCH